MFALTVYSVWMSADNDPSHALIEMWVPFPGTQNGKWVIGMVQDGKFHLINNHLTKAEFKFADQFEEVDA